MDADFGQSVANLYGPGEVLLFFRLKILPDFFKSNFSSRHHLKKFVEFFAGIFVTIGTIFKTLLLTTLPYLTNFAVTKKSSTL